MAISNVPGSPVPLYLAGAKMLDYYPVSIVVHGVALNITVQSYMGQLCFGLIACRRAVPDVRDIAVQMQRAFDTLQQLPLPGARRRPGGGRNPRRREPAAKAAPRRARRQAAGPKARPKLRVVAKAPLRARAARQAKVAG